MNKTGIYIGSTVDFRQRWQSHGSLLRRGLHGNPHLQSAWDLYGEAAFEFGVLEYLNDLEELHLAEQFWMDVYQEEGKELYNFGLAAYNAALGRPRSEEAKRKQSKTLKGHLVSEETRRKISKAHKGRPLSKEHRRKLSKARRRQPPASEETRRRMSEARRGLCNGAKPYPAFVHRETGEVIPAGINLKAMCRERGLTYENMCGVRNNRRPSCAGWILAEG